MSGGLFGVGSGEIILILLIILLVMGPDRLPQIARIWGKAMRFAGKFSNTWNQMNAQLMRQVEEEVKPVQNALRLDEETQPAPAETGTPQDPDPVFNTIAPPELASKSAVIAEPPTPEAVSAPVTTPATAEGSDV